MSTTTIQPIIKQAISNHPQFTNIKRVVVVRNACFQTDYEQIVFDAHIEYSDEDGNPVDTLKDEILDWIINNATKTTVRNRDGSPKENPNYDPNIPESEQYIKLPSFRYFYLTVTDESEMAVPLVPLLRRHIQLNDSEIQFFDKCKLGTRNR